MAIVAVAGRDIRGGWSPDGSKLGGDPEGHGTLVASVVIANRDGKGMHGVAPGATLLMARITDREGKREWRYPSGAIDWLVSQRTPYILLEFGYLDIAVSDATPEEYQFYHGDIPDAVRRGSAAGQRRTRRQKRHHERDLFHPWPSLVDQLRHERRRGDNSWTCRLQHCRGTDRKERSRSRPCHERKHHLWRSIPGAACRARAATRLRCEPVAEVLTLFGSRQDLFHFGQGRH